MQLDVNLTRHARTRGHVRLCRFANVDELSSLDGRPSFRCVTMINLEVRPFSAPASAPVPRPIPLRIPTLLQLLHSRFPRLCVRLVYTTILPPPLLFYNPQLVVPPLNYRISARPPLFSRTRRFFGFQPLVLLYLAPNPQTEECESDDEPAEDRAENDG